MIKSFLLLLLCLLLNVDQSYSQSDLNKDAMAFLKANCDNDIDDIIKLTNPDLLKVTSPAKIRRRLKQKNADGRRYECIEHKITAVSDVTDHSGTSYALVDLELDQTLTITKKLSEKEHQQLVKMFDMMFGSDWSQDGNVIYVKMEKQLVGDLRSDSDHWTFIDYHKTWLKQAEKNVIPQAVRDQLALK